MRVPSASEGRTRARALDSIQVRHPFCGCARAMHAAQSPRAYHGVCKRVRVPSATAEWNIV